MIRRAILLALLILIAACSQERGTVYSVPPDRARQTLLKTELPPVFGSAVLDVFARATGPSEVTWFVRQSGQERMRYIATLSDAGKGKTRVALKLKGATGDVEKRFAENPSVKNLYVVAMEEQIASSLEGRPLDMAKIYPAMGVAALANMGNMRKSLDEAVKASEELERSHRQSQSARRRTGDIR